MSGNICRLIPGKTSTLNPPIFPDSTASFNVSIMYGEIRPLMVKAISAKTLPFLKNKAVI